MVSVKSFDAVKEITRFLDCAASAVNSGPKSWHGFELFEICTTKIYLSSGKLDDLARHIESRPPSRNMGKQSGKLQFLYEKHKGRNVQLEKQRKREKEVEKKREEGALKKLQQRLKELGAEDEAGSADEVDRLESGDGQGFEDGEEESDVEDFEEFDEEGKLVHSGNFEEEVDDHEDGEDQSDCTSDAEQPALAMVNGATSQASKAPASRTPVDLPFAHPTNANKDDDENEDDGDQKDQEEQSESDVPLSEISSADPDQADLIPHQRLTINNTTALNQALSRIKLPLSTLPFSHHQSVTSTDPTASEIPNVDDDLNRELAFYAQSLSAVQRARQLLTAETVSGGGTPKDAVFTRPGDYFAEMVKDDGHMQKVKGRMVEEAAGRKASQDAKRQRELKKFGKAVQMEKLKERARQKRETLEQVSLLKRKRKGAGVGEGEAQGEGAFDVAVEDAAEAERRDKQARGVKRQARGAVTNGPPNAKRQKKNEKFGFGGKKKYGKSGDALSSADMRGFSTKRMKAGPRKSASVSGAKRLGKSRRAKVQ